MRINELFQVFVGITAAFLASSIPECVRCDHVHLRIHVPEIHQKHKHVKTKFVHVYHPKFVKSEPTFLLHSRKDPTYDLINGGYPHPLLNWKPQPTNKVTEDDFIRWQRDQQRKASNDKKRNVRPPHREEEEEIDDENDEGEIDDVGDENQDDVESGEDEKYTDQMYKKYRASKSGKSNPARYQSHNIKPSGFVDHRNHNYNKGFDASSGEKSFSNFSTRQQWSNKRPSKQSSHQSSSHSSYHTNDRDRPKKSKSNSNKRQKSNKQQYTSESNLQPQYLKTDIDENDPAYYSTLPRDQQFEASDHDDIYSGLLSRKPSRLIVDKSKILADINYNRKQQTKIFTAQNKQQQHEILQQ